MITDNRTNVQIVADALRSMPEAERDDDRDPAVVVAEYAVAALVAAQGAEPQTAKDIHEPDHDRVYCVRCGGNWPCQPAPVLPSSGVDEDKLAEVLREAEESWHLSDEKSQQSYACGAPDLKSKYIARAVIASRADWLRGQGDE